MVPAATPVVVRVVVNPSPSFMVDAVVETENVGSAGEIFKSNGPGVSPSWVPGVG